MDSPLSAASPRRRRFGYPAARGPGSRTSADTLTTAWLQRHPVAAAAFYMLFGGCIVYMLLGSSSSSSRLRGEQQQQQQQRDGIVHLPAMPSSSSLQQFNPTPAPSKFRVAQAEEQQPLCSDTCFKAKDGVCDDGRFLHNMTRGLASTVLCDLGTDCSDCGPYKGVQHSSSWKEAVGPIAFLRQHNLTVLTKKSKFAPSFHFAYTTPEHDLDASRDFEGFSTLETRLSHIAYHVLHGPCQQGALVGGGATSSSSSDVESSSGSDNDSSAAVDATQQQEQSVVTEGLMLDVGAGFGYYSLLAGMLGCRVIAWEPVKVFQAYMEYSIARNKLQHKIEVQAAAVSAPGGPNAASSRDASSYIQHLLKQPDQQQQQQRRLLSRQIPQQQQELQAPQAAVSTTQLQMQQQQSAGGNVTVVAPTRGYWGTASIGGHSIHLSLSSGGDFHKYNVPAETLDAVVMPLLAATTNDTQQQQHQKQLRKHARIALLKVDVEGHEPEAIAGAGQLLAGQLVDNVLLEYSPHFVELHNISQVSQYPRMLLQLLEAGFSLGHVSDMNYLRRGLGTYSEPLHQLQAVTKANLKFDLFDSAQLTEMGMTWLHEPCREMVSYGLISEGIPERLHPKSFRSTFESSTHLWATRQPRYKPYVNGPAVGVFPMDRKLSEGWFVEESTSLDSTGMGGRSCKNLREVAAVEKLEGAARASFLISHRCRCSVGVGDGAHSPCADEERIADACAVSGKTPYQEEPDYVAS